jgi:hypothetical protein
MLARPSAIAAFAAAAALVAALLGGCSRPGPVLINGYPVGEPARCDDGCARLREFATSWLDRSEPDHPPLDRIDVHVPDYRSKNGDRILLTGSGGASYIAVFVFENGSLSAVRVACGIGPDPWPCLASPPMHFTN